MFIFNFIKSKIDHLWFEESLNKTQLYQQALAIFKLMRILKFSFFLILQYFLVHGQEMDSATQKTVSDFIDCIKYKNIEKLAKNVSFPFSRKYPIPDIKDEKEFLNRYNQVFDDSLIKIITNSNPATDWAFVGYRGIMLLNGLVWLEYEGGSLIAVTYQSKIEEKKWKELVRIEKLTLHKTIRNFKQPICIIETPKYRIRIDDLGGYNYRYSSWLLSRKMSEKPDLVIENGEYIPEGSGGDGKYEFKTGEYIYDCSIIDLGEDDSPPALLEVYKIGKNVLSQEAIIIRK